MINKVRVVKLLGGGGALGLMDPKAKMMVHHGQDTRWIKAFNPSGGLCDLVMASGGTAVVGQAYADKLFIQDTDAVQWGWPNSADSVAYGHKHTYPSGNKTSISSGTVFLGGDGVQHTVYRTDGKS